jgi:hypothetical protein
MIQKLDLSSQKTYLICKDLSVNDVQEKSSLFISGNKQLPWINVTGKILCYIMLNQAEHTATTAL